jgi:hypothetical protein
MWHRKDITRASVEQHARDADTFIQQCHQNPRNLLGLTRIMRHSEDKKNNAISHDNALRG